MFVLLLLLWVIFNGRLTVEILLFGIVIAGLVTLFACLFMGYPIRKEIKAISVLPHFIMYVLVLIREIMSANITLLKYIVKGQNSVHPALYRFNCPLRSSFLRTVLADSITLTPGTITVSLKDDELIVHCLDAKLSEGLKNSCFTERLLKIERIIESREVKHNA